MGYKDYLADEENHRKDARNIISSVDKIKKLDNLNIRCWLRIWIILR
ncbi:hypothetical protein ACFL40_03365 [candidate division KSB1 bacterium]